MQRLLLLFLSISLGVLVFLCSQGDFNLPILVTDSTKIQLKSFQPFYYAALHIATSEEGKNDGIARFLDELQKQNLTVSEPFFIFRPIPGKSRQSKSIIATRIPESMQITSPLYKAKWNWQNVLIWDGSDKDALGLDSEKLIRYLKEQSLFAVGPVVEIYENSGKLIRKFWLPVQKEVGN